MTEQKPMRTRTKLVLGASAASLSGWLAFTALTDARAEQTSTVDAGVETVRVSGLSTAVRLETSSTIGRNVLIETKDKRGCGLQAHLERKAEALEIRIERTGWSASWWCEPEVSVVLPEQLNLSIALDNLAADLAGRFRAVAIESPRSVIHFKGSADQFDLVGEMAAVDLNFAGTIARDAIRLDVETLLSNVSFY